MNWFEYFDGYQTALVTTSGALFGVIITSVFHLIQKYFANRHERNMKKLDFVAKFKSEQLVEPVIKFLDSDLAAMQETYSLVFVDKGSRSNFQIKSDHLASLPAVTARVKGLGDPKLNALFDEFTRKRLSIGNSIDSVGKDPFKELQSAITLAGDIVGLLLDKVRDVEN